MGRKKTVKELRADLARVFFDRMDARKWYGFEEAQAVLCEIDAGPQVIDECFGGSLKGGMYKNDLRTAVASAIEGADKVIAALREQPDAALELLTESDPEDPTMTEPKDPTRACECGEGTVHNPLRPLRPGLTFEQLQAVSAKLGPPLSCAMCGHRFPPDAETPNHECKQRLIASEIGLVQPLPIPVGLIFYLDYKYGTKT